MCNIPTFFFVTLSQEIVSGYRIKNKKNVFFYLRYTTNKKNKPLLGYCKFVFIHTKAMVEKK